MNLVCNVKCVIVNMLIYVWLCVQGERILTKSDAPDDASSESERVCSDLLANRAKFVDK